jgi:regulatory protein
VKIISIKKKGGIYQIRFENNSTLLLDGDLLYKFNLHEDLDLSDEDLNVIIRETEFRKAYSSALRILARRNHSVNELIFKLKQKKHKSEAVDRVIENLLELNYLNDERFANEYFEYSVRRKKIGPIKISYEMKKKGISREIMDKVVSGGDEDTFFKNASAVAEKKMNALKIKNTETEKIRQKLFAHLQQKGYETDTIYRVLNNMNF